MSTKLGQNLQLVSGYKSYQQFDPNRYVGVTGVKSILKIQFYWKCFFSFILHSRVTWFMHIIKLKTLYKTYCLIFLNGVIWGHQMSEGHIHEKCFNTIFWKLIIIRFEYMLWLLKANKSYQIRNSFGVMWGRWGQKWEFTYFYTMFYNCYKIIVLIMILNFQNVLKYKNYGNLLCISFKIK